MSVTAPERSRSLASGPILRGAAILGLTLLTLPFLLSISGLWEWPDAEANMMAFAIVGGLILMTAGLIERRWAAVATGFGVALICADGYVWPHVLGML